MSSIRNGMYSAKSLKDSMNDKSQFENSSNDIKFAFFKKIQSDVLEFCIGIKSLLRKEVYQVEKDLLTVYKSVTSGYTDTLKQLYKEGTAGFVNETEITTMLNFNREIITAFKSMVFAIKDYRLDRERSKKFDEMPGFIR